MTKSLYYLASKMMPAQHKPDTTRRLCAGHVRRPIIVLWDINPFFFKHIQNRHKRWKENNYLSSRFATLSLALITMYRWFCLKMFILGAAGRFDVSWDTSFNCDSCIRQSTANYFSFMNTIDIKGIHHNVKCLDA